MAYLGHGEKTNYSANRISIPPGRNSQSARAEQLIRPGGIANLPGRNS